MKKILWLAVLAVVLFSVSGCCSQQTGSREFIPGKGWVPND
jgi:hypothetical protein